MSNSNNNPSETNLEILSVELEIKITGKTYLTKQDVGPMVKALMTAYNHKISNNVKPDRARAEVLLACEKEAKELNDTRKRAVRGGRIFITTAFITVTILAVTGFAIGTI
jgi:hypothetical protein